MYCSNCGNKNDADAKFCGKCGTEQKVKDINQKNNLLPNKASVPKKILGIILAIVSFILIAALLQGILGILLAAAVAGWCLKYFGVVSPNSAWVSETKGLKIAKYIILVLVGIAVIGILSAIILSAISTARQKAQDATTQSTKNDAASQNSVASYNQTKIAASVVNIYCSDGTKNGGTGGSGTIMTDDGGILTNAHIIPQDSEGNALTDECTIILPNAVTGQAEEAYYGKPTIVPILSEKYDLAFIEADNVVLNKVGKPLGQYSKVFPAFKNGDGCSAKDVALGEPIHVFGYPEISDGGYSLTITDGTISSLPSDGSIVTSAKISHGNSGGLAVDSDGCMVGIPTSVNTDENESLGVIIPRAQILEFFDKVEALEKLIN